MVPPPLCSVPPRCQVRDTGASAVASPKSIKIATFNVRGCTNPVTRCQIGRMFQRQELDVCALSETMMSGSGEVRFGDVVGRASGIVGGSATEGVALLLSDRMTQYVEEWKLVSDRLMWVRITINKECWVFLSAFGPGIEEKEEVIDQFWNDLSDCVGSFCRNEYVVVLGDLNAKVGNEIVEGIVGKFGVPGIDDNGERLLEMCDDQELVVGNTLFEKKEVNRYTWIRKVEGRVIDWALVDYVLISKSVHGRLLNVNVRGKGEGISDHCMVEATLRVVCETNNF